MKTNHREFGLQILILRKKARLTQAELAANSGISRNYISMIERGIALNVSIHVMRSLASGLNLSLGNLPAQIRDYFP